MQIGVGRLLVVQLLRLVSHLLLSTVLLLVFVAAASARPQEPSGPGAPKHFWASKPGAGAKALFDAQHLVPLGHAFAARE
jgi:hypothetical protein